MVDALWSPAPPTSLETDALRPRDGDAELYASRLAAFAAAHPPSPTLPPPPPNRRTSSPRSRLRPKHRSPLQPEHRTPVVRRSRLARAATPLATPPPAAEAAAIERSPAVAARMERRWARPRRGPVATAQEAARKRRVVREVDRFVEDEQSPKKPHPSVPRLAARSINVVAAASSRSALSRKPRRARTPTRRPTLRSRKELKAAVAGGAAAAAAAAAAPSDDGDDDPYGDDEDFSDDDGDDRHPQPRGDGLNAQQRAARPTTVGIWSRDPISVYFLRRERGFEIT
jgi:hypothetical protein